MLQFSAEESPGDQVVKQDSDEAQISCPFFRVNKMKLPLIEKAEKTAN